MPLPLDQLRALEARYDGPIPERVLAALRRRAATESGRAAQRALAAARRALAWQAVRDAGRATLAAHRRALAGDPGGRAAWRTARRWLAVELACYAAVRGWEREILGED